MSAALLAELALKSLLCATAALALLRLLESRSAAEKSLVAHIALVSLLVLPLGMAGLPNLPVAAPPALAEMLPASAAAMGPPAAPAAAAEHGFDWSGLLLAAYAAPALALLLALVAATARLRRLRARAEVLVDPLWLTALAAAQRRLGLRHGTALLASRDICSPVSWGVLRPVILVDPAAAADAAQAEAIIAHELAHVVRLDWLKLLAARLATSLFWFNPLVWALAARCEQLREEAADDAVLRADIAGTDYAALLVGSARNARRGFPLAANGVAGGADSLAGRIAALLDPNRPRGTARLGWAAAVVVAALLINGALAAATPVVQAPFDRAAAASAAARLDRIGSPHTAALAQAIRRADWGARKPAGTTTFHEPRAVAPLVDALSDARPEVRRIALWGLSEMRPAPPAAAEPVEHLLGDTSPQVRAQAARALGDLAAVAAAPAIARLLTDPDAAVRIDAAHALGDLQDPASRPALEASLRDPDPSVRTKAAWALRQVAEAEAVLRRFSG